MKYFFFGAGLLVVVFISISAIKKSNSSVVKVGGNTSVGLSTAINTTITVSMAQLKSRGGLYLRYDDNMDNEQHYPYDKNAGKQQVQNIISKTPLVFNDDDVLGQGARYVLHGGDVINVTEDDKDHLLKFTSNNEKRNNELNFFGAVKNNLPNFNYFKMSRGIKFGEPANQVFKEIYIYYKSVDYKFAAKYTDTKYHDQLAFLNEYVKTNDISPEMKKTFDDMLYFDYATFKFRLASITAKNGQAADSALLADIALFKQKIDKSDEQYLPGFRSSLRNYVIYMNAANRHNNMPVYELIKQNFAGAAKDYLLYYTVNRAITSHKQDLKLLPQFYSDCKTDEYVAEIKKQEGLSAPGMQSVLSDRAGNKITLDGLIAQNKNTILYIDFWASWCVPCMEQMSYSARLHEKLKNKNVRFLYFSMDNSFSSWQSSSNQLNHNSADNFLVANNFKSSIASQFNLTTIPRYIIVKEGRVVSSEGHRPSDESTQKYLEKLASR